MHGEDSVTYDNIFDTLAGIDRDQTRTCCFLCTSKWVQESGDRCPEKRSECGSVQCDVLCEICGEGG